MLKEKKTYLLIGIFITLGVTLLLVMTIILGSAKFWTVPLLVETYCDESVQGLETGSAVKFRGVKIGSISEISFARIMYRNQLQTSTLSHSQEKMMRYVRIVMTIDMKRNHVFSGDFLKQMIEGGMRAQIKSQGVTGVSYIEFDFTGKMENQDLPICWEPENIYIPSAPSTIAALADTATLLFDRLATIDIQAPLLEFTKVCKSLTKTLEELKIGELNTEIKQVSSQLTETMASIKILSETATHELPIVATNINSLIVSAEKLTTQTLQHDTLGKINKTIETIDSTISAQEEPLNTLLQTLNRATRQFELFVEELRRDPSRLIIRKNLPENNYE